MIFHLVLMAIVALFLNDIFYGMEMYDNGLYVLQLDK